MVSVTTTKAKLDNGEEYKLEKLMRVEKEPVNTKPEPTKVIVSNQGGVKKYVRKIN